MANGTLDPLSSLIQGFQTGQQFSPEAIRQRQVANQLATQLQALRVQEAQQRVADALNPEAAMVRQIEKELALRRGLEPFEIAQEQRRAGRELDRIEEAARIQAKFREPTFKTGVDPETGNEIFFRVTPQGLVPETQLVTPAQTITTPETSIQLPEVVPSVTPEEFSTVPSLAHQRLSTIPSLGQLVGEQLGEERRVGGIALPVPGRTEVIPEVRRPILAQPRAGTDRALSERIKLAKQLGEVQTPLDQIDPIILSSPEAKAAYEAGFREKELEKGKGTEQERLAQQFQLERAERIEDMITDLSSKINSRTAGRRVRFQEATFFPEFLQSDEMVDVRALLESLKSNIFVKELQAMRSASRTGGALGNVSNREGDKLANVIAALDQKQSAPALKEQLRIALESIRAFRAELQKQGGKGSPTTQVPPPATTTQPRGDPLGIRRRP